MRAPRRWPCSALNWEMCNALHGPTRVIAYGGMDIAIKESGQKIGPDKALKAREWLVATHALHGRDAQHHRGRISLWSLLSPSGGARSQEDVSTHGRHAQNAGRSCPFTHA